MGILTALVSGLTFAVRLANLCAIVTALDFIAAVLLVLVLLVALALFEGLIDSFL